MHCTWWRHVTQWCHPRCSRATWVDECRSATCLGLRSTCRFHLRASFRADIVIALCVCLQDKLRTGWWVELIDVDQTWYRYSMANRWPSQGDHYPDNVKFPDNSQTVRDSAALGMLSITHIMLVLVLLSGGGDEKCQDLLKQYEESGDPDIAADHFIESLDAARRHRWEELTCKMQARSQELRRGEPSPSPLYPSLRPSPSPPLPCPLPYLRSRHPLNQLRGLGERCKLPQRSPSRNWFWCILASKSGIWWQHF